VQDAEVPRSAGEEAEEAELQHRFRAEAELQRQAREAPEEEPSRMGRRAGERWRAALDLTMKLGDTPWVDKTMTKVWDRIAAAAPEPSWVPRHLIRQNDTIRVTELGCGHYGCVMPTADPHVVCKLTSDPTEGTFIAAAMSLSDAPDGLVKYFKIYAIPDTKHARRPVFVLWRETATVVGMESIRRAMGAPYQMHPIEDPMRREKQRGLNALSAFLTRFRDQADFIRNTLKKSKDPYAIVAEARSGRGYRSNAAQGVYFALVHLQEIVEEMQQTYLCDSVGEALNFYLENDLVLADVHTNNIGLVERQTAPVITDPGHAVPLSDRWKRVSIPSLP
jgi:hypothetical protein